MGIARIILFLICISLLSITALAQQPADRILINSQDWTDVYSAMQYSALTDNTAAFLVSDTHSTIITASIPKNLHLWAFNSQNSPYVRGFDDYLIDQGYTVDGFEYDNFNLELGQLLELNNYIVVDDSYGYNAVAVAPFAVASNAYVLFADAENINEVANFLESRTNPQILVYGHVDRQVMDELSQYNPEVINQDGDRFANNVEIVKKYRELNPARQVILTNGEFIEQEIMSGIEPVLFIGRSNVPDVIREYIQSTDIQVGVLIGNELVNTATFIRRQVGISVFVKFARSARNPSATIAQVEALDMFRLPTVSIGLALDSVTYNRATSELEVTLQNTQDTAVYFRGTYTITENDGTVQTTGDASPVFLEGGQFRTLTYDIESIDVEGTRIAAFVIYGESRNSLEYIIDLEYCLGCAQNFGVVDVIDNCEMDITEVSYVLRRQLFNVEAANIGQVGCFIDIELVDAVVAAQRVSYGLESVAFLEPGETRALRIRAELEEEDLPDNEFVNVKGYYGQRENSLTRVIEKRLPLLSITAVFGFVDALTLIPTLAIIVLIALIIWAIFRKRRKKQN